MNALLWKQRLAAGGLMLIAAFGASTLKCLCAKSIFGQ